MTKKRREFSFAFTLADLSEAIIGAHFLCKSALIIDVKYKRLIDPLTNLHVETSSATCDSALPKLFSVDNKYTSVFKEIPSLFSEPDYKLIKHSAVHTAATENLLHFSRPRRLAAFKAKIARREFELLVHFCICRPSNSLAIRHFIYFQRRNIMIGDHVKISGGSIRLRF